ncbi:hypothetical protein RP20_CCG022757 [Aedes albopictus]|nr:hypothetical protein RP20_CCG022757 [Aedes albopictus]
MAPRTKRSIIYRPVDKISQLFCQGPKIEPGWYGLSYHSSFQPADLETYVAGRNHPVIDGYYTQMKDVIEHDGKEEEFSTVPSVVYRKSASIGEQRNLGTVKNLRETKRRTHGMVTTSSTDIRKIIFPGGDEEEDDQGLPDNEEVALLKRRVHGAKSNSDPTGERTKKALKYETCGEDDGAKEKDTTIRRKRIEHGHLSRTETKSFKRKSNFIVNREFDDKFLSLQEAIQYLTKIRSTLVKTDKSAIDACRKSTITCAKDGIQILVSKSSISIEHSKLQPVIETLNLNTIDQANVHKFWDLFDHQHPLSGFKFGRLVKIFPDEPSPDDLSQSKSTQQKEKHDRLEQRSRAKKFKDYDTAGDLISPKPGTPFGLGHVDYFLPRVSQDIKTIFRNFDLDESTFQEAWREARKLETCEMNKVSAENFRAILKQKNVELLHR